MTKNRMLAKAIAALYGVMRRDVSDADTAIVRAMRSLVAESTVEPYELAMLLIEDGDMPLEPALAIVDVKIENAQAMYAAMLARDGKKFSAITVTNFKAPDFYWCRWHGVSMRIEATDAQAARREMALRLIKKGY